MLGSTPVRRVVEFFCESLLIPELFLTWNSLFFFVFAFNRTNIDHLSLSRERNVANPAYQRYQGKQGVQRSGIENPGNGLADWFVIKHTKDQVLLRYLLSKYGFKAADGTQVGIIKNKGKLPFYCVWPAVFKAITVQIQGTRSLPAGEVEKVVLVHNSFFVCLFESFFFSFRRIWRACERIERE